MPERILTRVDFPAPFSPTSTWTSPARRSNATLSRATTPGNCLDIPRSSRTGADGRVSDIITPGEGCSVVVIRNAHWDGWRDPSWRSTTGCLVRYAEGSLPGDEPGELPLDRFLAATPNTGRRS